ncbi:MAG: hypothetical protein ACTHNE_10770, partial [Dyella sp.]
MGRKLNSVRRRQLSGSVGWGANPDISPRFFVWCICARNAVIPAKAEAGFEKEMRGKQNLFLERWRWVDNL